MKNRQWVVACVAAMAALSSFAVVAASAPVPAVQSEAAGRADFHAPLRERAQAAAASGKPLDLLVASRLMLPLELSASQAASTTAQQGAAWLEQAIRLGSDQPIIARAAVTRCLGGGSCDIPAAVQTLQTRESDEVVAQLLLWQMQTAKGDADAAAQAWARATQATRYADDFAEGVALLDRATGGVQWPASTAGGDQAVGVDGETNRAITVFALVSASWMPGLSDVYRQCPPDVAAERREPCRHLFTVMAESGSHIAALIGVGRMRDLSDDAAERESWEARNRELMWLSLRSTELLSAGPNDVSPLNTSNHLKWTGEMGELPALRRLLADNGVAAQPPADWKPAWPSK